MKPLSYLICQVAPKVMNRHRGHHQRTPRQPAAAASAVIRLWKPDARPVLSSARCTARRPETNGPTVRDTGRFWPVVRGTLQEPAWSQIRAKTAEARTRLRSAAIAQLFVHRGNIPSALGLFGTKETREGAGQDPRPLTELLLEAEAGNAAAWPRWSSGWRQH